MHSCYPSFPSQLSSDLELLVEPQTLLGVKTLFEFWACRYESPYSLEESTFFRILVWELWDNTTTVPWFHLEDKVCLWVAGNVRPQFKSLMQGGGWAGAGWATATRSTKWAATARPRELVIQLAIGYIDSFLFLLIAWGKFIWKENFVWGEAIFFCNEWWEREFSQEDREEGRPESHLISMSFFFSKKGI